MSVVEFKANDKDYIDKLNLMSQQAGDVQQAKADAEGAVDLAAQEVTKAAAEVTKAKEETQSIVLLRDEVIQLKSETQAIALGDINGLSPNFANVTINGLSVYHPGNKPSLTALGIGNIDNTSDADKPISTAQQEKFTELDASIRKARILGLAGAVL